MPPLAVITGGGTGLGRAQAIALAQSGATVIVVGRRKEPLEAVQQEIGAQQCHILPEGDVGKLETWERIVEKVKEVGDSELHILCNTAGSPGALVDEGFYDKVTPESIIDYNATYISSVQLSYHFLAPFLQKGAKSRGKPSVVINCSSIASAFPRFLAQLAPFYVPCKAAMEAITRCAYIMYKDDILSYSLHPVVYESPAAHVATKALGTDIKGFATMANPFPVVGEASHVGAITVAWLEGTVDESMESGVGYAIWPIMEDGSASMLCRLGVFRENQDSLDPLFYPQVYCRIQQAYTQDGKEMPVEELKYFRQAMEDRINQMERQAAEYQDVPQESYAVNRGSQFRKFKRFHVFRSFTFLGLQASRTPIYCWDIEKSSF